MAALRPSSSTYGAAWSHNTSLMLREGAIWLKKLPADILVEIVRPNKHASHYKNLHHAGQNSTVHNTHTNVCCVEIPVTVCYYSGQHKYVNQPQCSVVYTSVDASQRRTDLFRVPLSDILIKSAREADESRGLAANPYEHAVYVDVTRQIVCGGRTFV